MSDDNDDVKTYGETRIPWPGPQPYDEEDWDDFFGRDAKLSELLDRVPVDKLTILLGASGTGKTSLIRAGLVPLLRQKRYHALQGSQGAWPVLLLRRWGTVGSRSLEENLLLQLELAIDAIQDWGTLLQQDKAIVDADLLRGDLKAICQDRSGSARVLEVVEELARAQARRREGRSSGAVQESGIILIFDQFEEQLRAGRKASSDALELIGNLFRSKAPTRVLVSMRQEYQYALRSLELTVGGLMGRSVILGPLNEPDVLDVIRQSSRGSHLPIDDEVADRIVKWLTASMQIAVEEPLQDYRGDHLAEVSQEEKGRPDLLQLQAVLLELCHYAMEKGHRSVSMGVFEDFSSQFVDSGGTRFRDPGPDSIGATEQESLRLEAELSRRVLGGALERWIDSALRGITKRGPRRQSNARSRSHAEWADMEEKDLRLQVHRIAVRLAPRLSSGDYKVAQEEFALFRQALGEEISKVGLKDPELRSKIRIIESEGMPPRLNWDSLGFVNEPQGEDPNGNPNLTEIDEQPSESRTESLSGLARVKGWSLITTGNQIVICFKETLHRLAAANILQCTFFGDEKGLYWELVHDQFGPSFTKWAERQRGTWDDCESSLVVCSGLQPIAVPVTEISPPNGSEFYDLSKISWQGCGVESSRSERLTLRRVRFRECFLVGTIFDKVDFIGCIFEACSLDGVLFRDCHFQSDGDQPTVFIACDSNVAILGGVIGKLEFRDCHLQQPSIINSELEGEICYTEGSRVIQGFYHVRKGNLVEDVGISFSDDSSACFCTASRKGFGFVDFPQALDLHNYKIKDDFRTRKAPYELVKLKRR